MASEIAFYLICALWIVFACWYDFTEIKAGTRPIHVLESIFQFLIIGIIALMLFYGNWKPICSHILIYLVLRIVFYSPILNLFRNKGLSYIGEDLPQSSLEDRFYHKVNRLFGQDSFYSIWQWLIKAIICTGIYLLIKFISHGKTT